MKKIMLDIIGTNNISGDDDVDKYDGVTTQIINSIKEKFSFSGSDFEFDDEIQKKITDIIKNNFSVKYEYIGMELMRDIRMFDYRTGYEFYTPLFTMPLFTNLGAMVISAERFPNFNIKNEYVGYTEDGLFYRINDFTLFMRYMRKQPLAVIGLFSAIYLIIGIVIFTTK